MHFLPFPQSLTETERSTKSRAGWLLYRDSQEISDQVRQLLLQDERFLAIRTQHGPGCHSKAAG